MIKKYLLGGMVLLIHSGIVNAACVATGPDGELADESCAETQVSMSIPTLARVAALDPFNFGAFDYENPPTASDDFCIWYNAENFSMTVNSANSVGNTFGMVGTNTTERIPYEVTWYDRTGNAGNSLDLTNLEDVVQEQLTLPEVPQDSNCASNNVSMNLVVPLANLEDKPEDSYSDTITVTVSVQ